MNIVDTLEDTTVITYESLTAEPAEAVTDWAAVETRTYSGRVIATEWGLAGVIAGETVRHPVADWKEEDYECGVHNHYRIVVESYNAKGERVDLWISTFQGW